MKSLLSIWVFDWRKLLAYTHRWLGIAGCVLFVAWFVSGVVMMYARMPGLANEERLARAPALDLSAVALSPAEAAEKGASVADHATHLIVHGMLHLLGYDHERDDEAERMEALERVVLEGLGLADPYAVRES